ncbi:MAG: hypothetical protein LBJ12_08790 [Oscillospiraceae bacterium]|jgi:hypothetical protein|nr:hypothetical protein [Oscillospiraceae bacterium]
MHFLTNLKSKTILTAAALLLAVSMAVGTTRAWQDYSQHKTNEAVGAGEQYGARLVEDYKPVTDWKISDGALKKEIRVKNVGDLDGAFGEVYVRIQLKEFMEIAPVTYKKTDERYAIDKTGAFYCYETKEAALAAYPEHVAVQLKDALSGTSGWFIRTKQGDDNGQYGDFVVTEYEVGAPVPVIPGSVRAQNPGASHHADPSIHSMEECAYSIHKWSGMPLPTAAYVTWGLNSKAVIFYSDWAKKPESAAKWVIDDREGSAGWVYWVQALKPGESTTDFLKTITLIAQPDGGFYYAIHTELNAVSKGDLGLWTDAPAEIVNLWQS